jgi:lipopolysaccharide transport system permease protein
LAIYALVFIYAGLSIHIATLLFIPGFLLFCVNTIWISCVLAMICARFRDIQQLVITFLQIALFLTPIFWTPDQLTGRTAIVAELNPLYHLIAIVRDPLLGVYPATSSWLADILIAIVGWALTMYMLTKFRRRIVYWL